MDSALLISLGLGALGGGGIGGLVTARLSWKRDRRDAETDDAEAQRTWRQEAEAATSAATSALTAARAATDTAHRAEVRAIEAERLVSYAVAENADLKSHHLGVMWAVARGDVPPWRRALEMMPDSLRGTLTAEDYPPDDGQPEDLTH